MAKRKVAILYGGRSVEHGVSINSARNIFEFINKDLFEPFLIGISPSGVWYHTTTVTKEMEKELEQLEIELDNTNGEDDKEVKIITKKIELHTDGEGKDLDWESKDGETRVMIMSSGDKEDFTLVLVTENYDEANEGKTKMIFEHKTKEMNLHPNPNDGLFMIRFESDENAKTTITVTDANGKKVLEEKLGKFSGKYEKEVDLKQYGSGLYTITIQSGDNVNIQKVMIK